MNKAVNKPTPRKWTDDETQALLNAMAADVPVRDVAQALGRTESAVMNRWYKTRHNYQPAAATHSLHPAIAARLLEVDELREELRRLRSTFRMTATVFAAALTTFVLVVAFTL